MNHIRLMPSTVWLRHITIASLRSDVMAGITLAAYLIPAGLGDASLAGLPPEAGLYPFNPNREFLGLAMANLGAGAGQGFPVSGGMTQSLVNESAGASTPLSGLVSSLIILLVVLFFSDLLRNLPQPVLAAVVLTAVTGLFKIGDFRRLWNFDRGEFAVAVAALVPLRLNFPYEEVLDAREFDEPAGYSLLRILPDGDDCFERCKDRNSRPVIVFDPRAGHGPGIGGFKRDSEVGMALHQGHPVYFVAHHMQPCKEQTLAHVHHALRRFVAEVVRRHPGERSALYGNCQAGWAVALLAADCAGVTGPTILNGAPLSYWGGEAGVNPMRLAGGLNGGVWIARLLADLSGGQFDGAWLAHNFEQLNPGHAYFGKYKVSVNNQLDGPITAFCNGRFGEGCKQSGDGIATDAALF